MSLRPPDPKRVTLDDLIPGDIVLSCGDSRLDRLIALVDQGDYSHAALYMGRDDQSGEQTVIEATLKGVKQRNVDVDLSAQYLVDIYRYHSPQGDHFGNPEWPVQPVLDQAITFVGAKYAYSELLMAAIVLLVAEKSSPNPDFEALIRLGELLLAHGLEAWLKRIGHHGKTPMTCVQVATTAYWQATVEPPHKYGLQVQLVRPPAAVAPPSAAKLQEWHAMRERIKSAVDEVAPQPTSMRMAVPASVSRAGLIVTAGSPQLPLGLCTLRDLETSPTLQFIGCLKDTRAPLRAAAH